jgi:hypothetical protein
MEVYGSTVDAELLEQPSDYVDPVLAARIDEELASIDAALLDARQVLDALEETGSADEIEIIRAMDLVGKAKTGVQKMESAAEWLNILREQNPTASDVDLAIAASRASIADANKMLIRRILPVQKLDAAQPADEDTLQRNLAYALLGSSLDAAATTAFLDSATQLNDRVTITVQAFSFHLYDATGADLFYTFVRKTLVLQDPVNDVTVIEVIPKAIASTADELSFSVAPVVLEDDPVVQYSYPVLQQESYSYVVERQVSMDDVRSSRTLLYPKPSTTAAGAAPKEQPLATGQATRVDVPFFSSAGSDVLLVAIGVLIILALGAYYLSLSSPPPVTTRRSR